jgi:hypothetical protein
MKAGHVINASLVLVAGGCGWLGSSMRTDGVPAVVEQVSRTGEKQTRPTSGSKSPLGRISGREGGVDSAAEPAGRLGGDGTTDHLFDAQRAMAERLGTADPKEYFNILLEVNTIKDQTERRTVREILYMKMAQTDPAGSLTLFKTFERSSQFDNYLRAWSLVDREAAAKWAMEVPKNSKDRANALSVLTDISRRDPEGYMRDILRHAPESGVSADWVSNFALYSVFGEMAQTDLTGAKEKALSGGSAWDRGNSSFGLTWEWARKDPAAALSWAEGLKDAAARGPALRGVVMNLAQKDPDKALELFFKHRDLLKSQDYGMHPGNAIASGLSARNWREGVGFIRSIAEEKDMAAYINKNVVPHMGGASAADWAGLLEELPKNSVVSVEMRDLQKGFRDAVALPASPGREALLAQLGARMAGSDPQDALTKAKAAGPSTLKALGSAAAEAMITMSRPQLFGEAANLVPEDERSGFYARMASSLGETAPHLLQDFVTQAPEGDARQLAAVETARAWSNYHPATALEWANTQPETERPRLLYEVAKNWAEQDPWGTSQWAAKLPQGAQRDAAVWGLVGSLSSSEPASALAWADTISDSSMRQRLISRTLTAWHATDPEGAAGALQSVALSDEVRLKLAKTFGENQ